MNIRDKLSIQFTTLVAAIFLIFCLMIYYISVLQHKSEFYNELRERAQITAYIFLEEDGFSKEVYTAIAERYVQSLPEERAQLYDSDNQPRFIETDELELDDELINYIRENYSYPSTYDFYIDDRQAVGLHYQDNQGDFVVVVSALDTTGEVFLENLALILIIGFLFSLLVILVSGRFFANQAVKPIPRIVRQVKRISASNLNLRLDGAEEKDELGELVSTFNDLLSKLEDSFEVQNRFVANASHELRTPLTSIIGEVEVALTKERTSEEYISTLNSIHHDAMALEQLTTGLLELAQAESERLNDLFYPIHLDELVLEAAIQIEKKYPGSRVNVNYEDASGTDAESFRFFGSEPLLHNVFLNVLDNAVKFSGRNPTVDVLLREGEGWIEVQVRDYGIGISGSDKNLIFSPFYRSSKVSSKNGYGIGLSLVKRVLNVLNGTISYVEPSGKGAQAILRFQKVSPTAS